MEYSIPEKRELSEIEVQLLSHLFKMEKPEWISLIGNLNVIARCGCGKCPTILLGETPDSEIQIENLIIDYIGKSPNGQEIGISLFGTDTMPTELEFYSLDGEFDVKEIPMVETLRPITY
jgi:hypothetical protein